MSKKAIDLMSVNVNKIVVSGKFELNEDAFEYFIGYQKGEIVRPLWIILHQMSGYIKYVEYGSSNISFFIKDDRVRGKQEQIWDVIKNKLKIKFHSEPVYEYKYLKTKVREYDGVIETNFLGDDNDSHNDSNSDDDDSDDDDLDDDDVDDDDLDDDSDDDSNK